MVGIMEIMQLCRLCLVKEQVNIPIFEDQGDIRQIYLKITACLPVKVSKEDKLPKKICDGCLYKLELLYQFWNSTASAEKQLLSWIKDSDMEVNSTMQEELASQSQLQEHTVKQEKVEPAENTNESVELSTDAQSYILQQQQLSYQPDYPFKESQGSNAESVDLSENLDEPISKRRRRRQATKPIPPESLDSSENEATDSFLEMTVTKTEEESESNGDENIDDSEAVTFPAVSVEDTEQPGPSGLGKGSTDAPFGKINNFKAAKTTKRRTKNRTWLCKNCSEEFPTRKSMVEHRRNTHAFPLELLEYKYTYNSVDDLYTCKTCDTEMKSKEEIEKHMLDHEDKFVCAECQEVFYSAYKFAIHVRKHADEEIYKCPLCEYSTVRRTSISIHINSIHLKKFLYYCQFCGKGFQDVVTFKDHENIHMGASPIVCIVCKKQFSFNRNLVVHQVRNHKVTILGVPVKSHLKQCKVCKKTYSKIETLERHMKTHDKSIPKETTHLCDTCGKGFARKDKLILHYRVHTGYKPYKCSYCAKCFTKKEYLVMHERIHSGEKPYCCLYCGKCFNQDGSLRIHVRSHTGERPYVCQICNNGFVSRASLKLHLNNCNKY